MLFWSPNLRRRESRWAAIWLRSCQHFDEARQALLLRSPPGRSTARSHTQQSLSLVASMSFATARSSLVWFRISMAARRMS